MAIAVIVMVVVVVVVFVVVLVVTLVTMGLVMTHSDAQTVEAGVYRVSAAHLQQTQWLRTKLIVIIPNM